MIAQFLKGYMPRSLYGRAALIVLVPVLTILAVMAVVFIQRLYEDVTRQMTNGVADEIQLILDEIEASDSVEAARERAGAVGTRLDVEIDLPATPIEARRDWIDLSGITVRRTLEDRFPGVTAVDLAGRDGWVSLTHDTSLGPVTLHVPRGELSPRNPHQFLVLIGFTAFAMTAIALLYLRGQMRPIRRLAAAASAFGKGRTLPYRPSGATEVREAGQAFLEMRDRIEHQIEQRTMMLSGVSHDLRTPLTRMKLALSMMDGSEDVDALLQDVSEMEDMLDAFLDFAKGDAGEAAERVSVEDVIAAARDRSERAAIPLEIAYFPGDAVLKVRPMAIGRAIDNLIGNAVRYGKKAYLSAEDIGSGIAIIVEDDGPGIPEHLRAEATKPFTRLDAARNQDSGSGVGLGLAIAADIARQHGGELHLTNGQAHSGLRAVIKLPK